jgi:hypothetical protein
MNISAPEIVAAKKCLINMMNHSPYWPADAY